MSIEVSCDCAMTYRLPDRFAGKRCRCRECGDSIRVPTLGEDSDAQDSSVSDSEVEDSDASESESESEEAVAEPVKKKAPIKARMKSQPSESIHQMSPLNLSESRCIDPPAARARIRKAKAAAATVNAKKRAAMGPQSESEIDTAPRPSSKKERLEKKSKKKGGKPLDDKRALRRRRDDDADDQDEDEDERPKKKKTKKAKKADKLAEKKAKKAEKAEKKHMAAGLGKKRRGEHRGAPSGRPESEADQDETNEDADEADADKPKLSPRQQKRRQQIIMLGGSFGALLLVGILFIVINAVTASNKEAREKKFADAKAKVAAARDMARTSANISDAEKAYADAIAFVMDPATPMPEEGLGDFVKDFGTFKAEVGLFKEVAKARAKLGSDAGAAFDEFNGLVGAPNDLIRELGLQGLIQTNDPRMAQICLPHANSSVPAIKALARKGAIQFGGKEASALLAAVIREEGPNGPLGKIAIERALDGRNEDPALIIAVAEKDTDPQHLVAALNLMSRIGAPQFKDACLKLTSFPNDEVQKLATRVLDELKGQDKVTNNKG